MGNKKFCRKCAQLIDDNSNVCPFCRAPDPIYGPFCPSCRRKVEESGVQCPGCGRGLWGKQVCPSCKALIDEKLKECPECFKKIKEPAEKRSWQFWKKDG